MRGRLIPWIFLFLCCVDVASFGQKVTIRIINLNGEPFKNKQVYISGLSAHSASKEEERLKLTGKPIRADLSLLTNSSGEASFDLPNPAPAQIYVRPAFSQRVWDCICFVSVATDALFNKGFFISFAPRNKKKPSIQPKTGEILFMMARTPWWWQLLYPIEKG